jgi:uncharacterized protein
VAIVFAPALSNRPAMAQDTAEGIGSAVAGELASGKFAEIAARFTPEMAKALPESALEQAWADLRSKAGPVRNIGTARIKQQVPVTVVIVPLQLERGAFDLQVSVAGGRVAGLFIVPAGPPPMP